MKKKKVASVGFTWTGAISFFILIAVIMQIAILIYDYIRERTDNVTWIAILILIEIIILATLCVVFDWIRRKLTVERPTKKILEATEKIADGDFSTRLEITHEYGKYNQIVLIIFSVFVCDFKTSGKIAVGYFFSRF